MCVIGMHTETHVCEQYADATCASIRLMIIGITIGVSAAEESLEDNPDCRAVPPLGKREPLQSLCRSLTHIDTGLC